MQTRASVIYHCPLAEHDVQLDEIYLVEGIGTCQVEWQLIHRECLAEAGCANRADCPLLQEYPD